jgi:MerR family mercuric resistance operon transcriptional regulator
MNQKSYTISGLAKEAGIGIETIRYYQRSGLIATPSRPTSGYRRYSQDAVEELRFIMRAKELGFTLAEIRELLTLDSNDIESRKLLARAKLDLIQQKIADLKTMASSLEVVVHSCQSSADTCSCPLRISRTWS